MDGLVTLFPFWDVARPRLPPRLRSDVDWLRPQYISCDDYGLDPPAVYMLYQAFQVSRVFQGTVLVRCGTTTLGHKCHAFFYISIPLGCRPATYMTVQLLR